MSDYIRRDCEHCGGTGDDPDAPHLCCTFCLGMRQVDYNPPLAVPIVMPEYPDEPPSRPA